MKKHLNYYNRFISNNYDYDNLSAFHNNFNFGKFDVLRQTSQQFQNYQF